MISIVKHYMQGCHWCNQWSDDVEPFIDPRFNLTSVVGGASAYPTFVITVGNNALTLVGYQTLEQINKAIVELQDAT